jgi:hypothetical protein
VVQGTNAAEHFIIAPKTSALVFAGNGDTVDLSGAITSYSFKTTGTQLQISDGTYTTTLSVGGTFTLRTASGSTSVAIDFTAGGAIKLGGTQIVGSQTFDPLAAITNVGNVSGNLPAASAIVLANSIRAYGNAEDLEELSITAPRQSAPSISLNTQQDGIRYGLSIEPIDYQMSRAYDNFSLANATDGSMRMAVESIMDEITFEVDFDPATYDGPLFINLNLIDSTVPESILDVEIWADLRHGYGNTHLTAITANYFDDKTAFNTSITTDAISYVM